jgi:hypothetical protein
MPINLDFEKFDTNFVRASASKPLDLSIFVFKETNSAQFSVLILDLNPVTLVENRVVCQDKGLLETSQ